MTEGDIIRIGGVEYEKVATFQPRDAALQPGDIVPVLRPKRKQTGWVCRFCKYRRCLAFSLLDGQWTPPPWFTECRNSEWVPYYGKVVE